MASNANIDSSQLDGDAEAYVDSIMSSQRVTRVATPLHSGRKRHHSDTEVVDSDVKKPRVTVQAKRSLYDNVKATRSGRGTCPAVVDSVGTSSTVERLIANLSADMHMLFSALSERVDKLEKGLEQKIANKVAQVLDKRMNTEINKIRKDVDTRCEQVKDTIREELKSEIEVVNTKIESLSVVPPLKDDIALNIVVRNLPESSEENTVNKINRFFKDGLKVHDVTCQSAVRKVSRNESRPGVVIVTMKTHDDKRKIMSKKSNLKNNTQYSKVFLDHDKSFANRMLDNNFMAILKAVRGHDLTVKGGRVVRRQELERGYDEHERHVQSAAQTASSSSSSSSSHSSRRQDDNNHHDRDNYDRYQRGGRGRRGHYDSSRGNRFNNRRF